RPRSHTSRSHKQRTLEMNRRLVVLFVLIAAGSLGAPVAAHGQAGRGVPAARPEDNRPPVFFREEWKHQFDRGGPPEGPVGQEHVSSPQLDLKYYGEAPK